MADIEQGKPGIQAVEYMETVEIKAETQMVPVSEDVQTRIRRKVLFLTNLSESH
jgi:hypothetical protein